MAGKPGARNWNDVQLVLAALAMTLTLGLWNLFAAPDAAEARKTAEQQPPMLPATQEPLSAAGTATPLPPIKILLGGVAPQLQVVQQPSARRASRSNGGGGPVTTTRSS